jgi:hypothetical protein
MQHGSKKSDQDKLMHIHHQCSSTSQIAAETRVRFLTCAKVCSISVDMRDGVDNYKAHWQARWVLKETFHTLQALIHIFPTLYVTLNVDVVKCYTTSAIPA